MTATIELNDKTVDNFSINKLEKFVNSSDFEDLVLGYQMIKGETGKIEDYSTFKNDLGL